VADSTDNRELILPCQRASFLAMWYNEHRGQQLDGRPLHVTLSLLLLSLLFLSFIFFYSYLFIYLHYSPLIL
jgi:hypothetical protein